MRLEKEKEEYRKPLTRADYQNVINTPHGTLHGALPCPALPTEEVDVGASCGNEANCKQIVTCSRLRLYKKKCLLLVNMLICLFFRHL